MVTSASSILKSLTMSIVSVSKKTSATNSATNISSMGPVTHRDLVFGIPIWAFILICEVVLVLIILISTCIFCQFKKGLEGNGRNYLSEFWGFGINLGSKKYVRKMKDQQTYNSGVADGAGLNQRSRYQY